jgi:hypothetical protein
MSEDLNKLLNDNRVHEIAQIVEVMEIIHWMHLAGEIDSVVYLRLIDVFRSWRQTVDDNYSHVWESVNGEIADRCVAEFFK